MNNTENNLNISFKMIVIKQKYENIQKQLQQIYNKCKFKVTKQTKNEIVYNITNFNIEIVKFLEYDADYILFYIHHWLINNRQSQIKQLRYCCQKQNMFYYGSNDKRLADKLYSIIIYFNKIYDNGRCKKKLMQNQIDILCFLLKEFGISLEIKQNQNQINNIQQLLTQMLSNTKIMSIFNQLIVGTDRKQILAYIQPILWEIHIINIYNQSQFKLPQSDDCIIVQKQQILKINLNLSTENDIYNKCYLIGQIKNTNYQQNQKQIKIFIYNHKISRFMNKSKKYGIIQPYTKLKIKNKENQNGKIQLQIIEFPNMRKYLSYDSTNNYQYYQYLLSNALKFKHMLRKDKFQGSKKFYQSNKTQYSKLSNQNKQFTLLLLQKLGQIYEQNKHYEIALCYFISILLFQKDSSLQSGEYLQGIKQKIDKKQHLQHYINNTVIKYCNISIKVSQCYRLLNKPHKSIIQLNRAISYLPISNQLNLQSNLHISYQNESQQQIKLTVQLLNQFIKIYIHLNELQLANKYIQNLNNLIFKQKGKKRDVNRLEALILCSRIDYMRKMSIIKTKSKTKQLQKQNEQIFAKIKNTTLKYQTAKDIKINMKLTNFLMQIKKQQYVHTNVIQNLLSSVKLSQNIQTTYIQCKLIQIQCLEAVKIYGEKFFHQLIKQIQKLKKYVQQIDIGKSQMLIHLSKKVFTKYFSILKNQKEKQPIRNFISQVFDIED